MNQESKSKKKKDKNIMQNPLFNIFLIILGSLILSPFGNLVVTKLQDLSRANMEIVGRCQKFEMPSIINKSNEQYREMIMPDNLEKQFPYLKNINSNSIFGMSYLIYSSFKEATLSAQINNLKLFDYMWSFDIKNKGGNKVDNLVLSLPFGGYYEVIDSGSKTIGMGSIEVFSNNKISLGSMQPSERLIIKIWSSRSPILSRKGKPYFYDKDNLPKLIFDNGAVNVIFKK